MTIKEVIAADIDILGDIKVPVELMEEVGMPISIARNNLVECMKAIERDEKANAEAKEAPEDGRVPDDGGSDEG